MISIFVASGDFYGDGFEGNGDATLCPSSCLFTARLNGEWYLEMTHPIDDEGRWEYIEEEAVIKVPTWHEDPQLFRISEIEKTDTEVKVTAYPIFYDAKNNWFITDVLARGTCVSAMRTLNTVGPTSDGTSIYSVGSNITKVKNIQVTRRNFLDALNGSEQPTIISEWGGEILFDNFSVYVAQELGSDNHVDVRYGKNITGVEYVVDYSSMCTRIYPQAHGGYAINSGQTFVDSPLVNNYAILYIKNMVFDNIRLLDEVGADEDTTNIIVCADRSAMDTALRQACADEFDKGVDKPTVSMSVDLLPLEDTDQYEDFSSLLEISLGDTVDCHHTKLGITSEARAVSVTWDCIRNRCAKVELGDFAFDYFRDVSSKIDSIASLVSPTGNLVAERVAGVIDSAQCMIRQVRSTADVSPSKAIIFEDRVSGSDTYGGLAIGTQGLLISSDWSDALGEWNWTTAVTGKGIIADTIVTGLLADKTATNYWNLDTGECYFTISAAQFDAGFNAMESADVCAKLFENGGIEGIVTQDNHFYISCSAILGGALVLGGSQNGNGYFSLLDGTGSQIIQMDKDGLLVKNGITELLKVNPADGILIGTDNSWGSEILRLRDAVITGLYTTNSSTNTREQRSSIDMVTQYGGNIMWDSDGSYTRLSAGTGLLIRAESTSNHGIVHESDAHYFYDTFQNLGAQLSYGHGSHFFSKVYFRAGTNLDDSDISLKENISDPEESFSELVSRLKVRAYDWKQQQGVIPKHVSAGLIAQEVEEVIPELVYEGAKGIHGIRFQGLIPFLIGAFQEQKAQLEAQQRMIKCMEERLSKLENK